MESYFKDRILLQYDCCHTRAKSPMHGVSKGFYTTFVSWLVTSNEWEAFSRLDVTENRFSFCCENSMKQEISDAV